LTAGSGGSVCLNRRGSETDERIVPAQPRAPSHYSGASLCKCGGWHSQWRRAP